MPLLRGSSKAVLDVLRSSPQGVAEALRLIGSSTPAAQQPAAAPAAKPPAPGTAGPAPPPANPNVMEVFVNDVPVTVPKNYSVLQACEAAGIDIPRFCYHPRLSIAGNCRMCLVEIEKSPKPVASCAMPAGPGMKIKTDTPVVKKAREGVMEFLLINHPLDCPICDQGGECDLQDQAMLFGSDKSRFTEAKRAVQDKNLGPLVKTVMTRCIHCTRCVRFAKEVAGVEDLGVTGRGRDSEVGTYVEKLLVSEMSGNVIDICPVGALTSKPAAFTYRNWELKGTESVDVSDGLGSNIRVDSRGPEVMRIVPRLNEDVNEEWISDKARFQYDALRRQRLNVPLVRRQGGGLQPATWAEALAAVRAAASRVKGVEMKAIAGKLADAESMMALKDLMNRLGCGYTVHEQAAALGGGGPGELQPDVRSTYTANTGVMGLEQADAVLLVGTNLRAEAPVVNARLRKMWLDGTAVALLGAPVDLSFKYDHLGSDPAALGALLASGGSPGSWLDRLKGAKAPVVVVGPGVLLRPDRDALLRQLHDLVDKAAVVRPGWNGFNVLHDSASRVAALDIGFTPSAAVRAAAAKGAAAPPPATKFVYLLGSDDYADSDVPDGAFVVYQGHHGERGAGRADVVLPGAAYTEKSGVYVNFEGRVQQTRAAVPPVGDAREDWKVLRAVSEVLGKALPYDSHEQVRARLAAVAPHFRRVSSVERPLWLNGEYLKGLSALAGSQQLAAAEPLRTSVPNFFMTDVISRASTTMAKCVQVRQSSSGAQIPARA